MQNTPTEHSRLVGGSTAARRIGCPASYKLEQLVPEQPSSPHAREGTALHELMAKILNEDADPLELLPFTHNQPAKGADPAWTLTIDHELWYRLGEPALRMFDDFAAQLEAEHGAPFEFMVEKRSEYPGLPGAFGTSDIPFRCGPVGGIWDWKFGRRSVSAKRNKQLSFYLRASMAAFPTFFADTIRHALVICQPQRDEKAPDVYCLEPGELDAFDQLLRTRVAQAQDDPNPEVAEGYWCDFARCAAVCPAKIGKVARLGELLKAREQAEKAQAPFDLSAFYAEAMGLQEAVEAWASTIAAQTQHFIDIGGTVPGWKTVPKRSSGREFTIDEKQVHKVLRKRGLKLADFAPRKTLTMPQIETLLKVRKLAPLDEAWYAPKPSSGTTLAREGDPREAAPRSIDQVSALATALNQKYGKPE